MSTLSARAESLRLFLRAYKPVVVLLLAVLGGVIGGLLATSPLLALASIVLLVVSITVLSWPEAATLLVIFILYSNIAVVLVRFHGVPFIAGAAFPLLLALPLAIYLVLERRPLRITPALPYVVLFMAAQQVSLLFSNDPAASFREVTNFVLEGFLIYLLVINVVRTPRTLRHVAWTLLLAGIVLTAAPFYQQITGSFDDTLGGFGQLSEVGFRTGETNLVEGDLRQYRLSGPIGEQNRYAQVLLMLVPLGWFALYFERSLGLKLLGLALAGVALGGVALSFSRGAAVAFVILVLAMLVTRLLRPAHFLVFLLLVAVVLMAVPQITVRLVTIPSVTDLLSEETTTSELDGAIRGRATAMIAAALVFADHPIVGVGPGQFQFYSAEYGNRLGIRILEGNREAHSLFLDVAANYGILGLISFLAMVLVPIRVILAARHKLAGRRPALSYLTIGFAFAILAYLGTGIFLHLSYVRYFWLMLGLADTAALIAQRAANEEPIVRAYAATAGLNARDYAGEWLPGETAGGSQ